MTPPPPLPLNGAAAVKRPVSSAVLAGWIGVGIGVCTFWIFGLGFYLIGLGAICGIVAMCTHQIKAGLVLLLGSIAAAGLCVVLMVVVVLGLLGAAIRVQLPPAAQSRQRSRRKPTATRQSNKLNPSPPPNPVPNPNPTPPPCAGKRNCRNFGKGRGIERWVRCGSISRKHHPKINCAA